MMTFNLYPPPHSPHVRGMMASKQQPTTTDSSSSGNSNENSAADIFKKAYERLAEEYAEKLKNAWKITVSVSTPTCAINNYTVDIIVEENGVIQNHDFFKNYNWLVGMHVRNGCFTTNEFTTDIKLTNGYVKQFQLDGRDNLFTVMVARARID